MSLTASLQASTMPSSGGTTLSSRGGSSLGQKCQARASWSRRTRRSSNPHAAAFEYGMPGSGRLRLRQQAPGASPPVPRGALSSQLLPQLPTPYIPSTVYNIAADFLNSLNPHVQSTPLDFCPDGVDTNSLERNVLRARRAAVAWIGAGGFG
jgi:hypothetical protein